MVRAQIWSPRQEEWTQNPFSRHKSLGPSLFGIRHQTWLGNPRKYGALNRTIIYTFEICKCHVWYKYHDKCQRNQPNNGDITHQNQDMIQISAVRVARKKKHGWPGNAVAGEFMMQRVALSSVTKSCGSKEIRKTMEHPKSSGSLWWEPAILYGPNAVSKATPGSLPGIGFHPGCWGTSKERSCIRKIRRRSLLRRCGPFKKTSSSFLDASYRWRGEQICQGALRGVFFHLRTRTEELEFFTKAYTILDGKMMLSEIEDGWRLRAIFWVCGCGAGPFVIFQRSTPMCWNIPAGGLKSCRIGFCPNVVFFCNRRTWWWGALLSYKPI